MVHADMYTFDTTEEAAWNTYSDVSLAYERIFQRLGLNAVKGTCALY